MSKQAAQMRPRREALEHEGARAKEENRALHCELCGRPALAGLALVREVSRFGEELQQLQRKVRQL